jgi:hypothetical protein
MPFEPFKGIRTFLQAQSEGGGRNGTSAAAHLIQELEEQWMEAELDNDFQIQVTAILMFVTTLAILRYFSRLTALQGQHVLDLSSLNSTVMYKEIFMAYLSAAILEPIMSISDMESSGMSSELIINIFTLGSICWWMWMVTDAFDHADVMQQYKYQVELKVDADADPKRFWWFQLKAKDVDAQVRERTKNPLFEKTKTISQRNNEGETSAGRIGGYFFFFCVLVVF